MLHGRNDEIASLSALLSRARQGHSGALVLRGEAGIGKSALLEHVADAAADFKVLRGSGVEFEADLPYSGLHMLLRPVVDRIDQLPPPQAEALSAALGMSSTGTAERYLVGLAVLTLLTEMAEEPVLCLIDDAHWLDHASAAALLFAARRLEAEGVVLLLAVRDSHAPEFPSAGIDEIELTTLDKEAAGMLLADVAADLPAYAREHIRGESNGNPLALRELVAAQREGQLTAEPYGVARVATYSRLQRTFADRIAALQPTTRTLLTVAAADDTRDLATVLAAAGRMGARIPDLEVAEKRELLRGSGGELEFRHPLIRAAAYHDAPLGERLAAHHALAAVLTAPMHTARRAWHLAAGTTEPDETVAAELDRTAADALSRGGYSAVAAAHTRAAELTPDSADRGRRYIAAAQAALDAGQLDRVDRLTDRASAELSDPVDHAEIAKLRGTAATWRGQPLTAHRIWTQAAHQVVEVSRDHASYLQFNAAEAAWVAGDFAAVSASADWTEQHRLRRAVRVRAMATVANGINGRGELRPQDAAAALRELLDTVAGFETWTPQQSASVVWWHMLLGDQEAGFRAATELIAQCRQDGALGVLPRALGLLARAQVYRGEIYEACAAANEAVRLASDLGRSAILNGIPLGVMAFIAAISGDEKACREYISDIDTGPQNHRILVSETPLALLDLGNGHPARTLERLSALAAQESRMDVLPYVPDLVEAAVRCERPEAATEAFEWFQDYARATGQPWARAVVARCQALLDDAAAATHFAAAMAAHDEGYGRPFERARTELLYAEWLRRERQPAAARPLLRSAAETFTRMHAEPWVARARSELRAAGERDTDTARPDPRSQLTPQELQVVRMAADGLTNRDIGAQLYLSPRTVGYHLYKAYPKLGVSSRGELARLNLG